MKTYWHRHPRDFANECAIVRCDDPAHTAMLEDAGYERLTRNELQKHIAWINGENDAWGSSRAFGSISLAAVTDAGHPEYNDYSSHQMAQEIAEHEREESAWNAWADSIEAYA